MAKMSFFLIAVFFLAYRTFAQHEPIYGIENIRKVIPPSPEASSLGKFGDIPVSLYTGIPQINIPIYTIQENGIEIPISLNYHAGGIRVEEHASWVGLGWSLSAGGVITRSVVGLADDEPGGYFTQPYDLENLENLSVEELKNVHSNVTAGTLDIEPDIYSFNFLSQAGKFIVNKATRKGIPVLKQNLRIEIVNYETPGDARIKGWKITDDRGNVFFFEDIERSQVRSHTAANRTAHVRQNHVSSWYLSRIVLRNLSVITFGYQSHASNYFTRQGASKYLFQAGGIPGQFECPPPIPEYEKYLQHNISGKHIESITFSNGTVKFVRSATERLDMPGDYLLDAIEVYNLQSSSVPIKKSKLIYSYFESNAGLNSSSSALVYNYNTNFKKRLRLDRVDEVSANERKIGHAFEYFPGELPSVFSNSQDHWGFYNGSNNSSLVPLDQMGYGSSVVSRAVSFGEARVGSLSRIYYPTGGYTDFDYESNEVSVTDVEYNTHFYPYGPISRDNYDLFGAAVYKFPEPDESILIDTLVVHPSTEPLDNFGNNLQYNVQLDNSSNCNGGDRTCLGTLSVTLTCIDCGNIVSYFNLASCQFTNGSCSGVVEVIRGMTYVLRIERGYEFSSVSAGVGGRFLRPPTAGSTRRNILVGGLRIKSVVNRPSSTETPLRTDYYYTSTANFVPESGLPYTSSGILTAFPVYDSYSTFVMQNRVGGFVVYIGCLFQLRTSNSRIPLGGMEGTVAGYTDVQTYKTDGVDKIKTISSFYTAADNPDLIDYSFPFTVLSSNAHMRGMLRKEVKFQWKNSQFVTVSESENHFEVSSNSYVPGVRTGVSVFMPSDLGQGDFIYKVYQIPSGFVHLASTRNTIYDENGGNPVTTETDNFYEGASHYNITRAEVTQSKGEVISTRYKYPHDFSAVPVYNEMVSRNVVSPVIEQSQFNLTLNKTLSTTITDYSFWSAGSLVDVQSIKRAFSGNPQETEVTVNEYDSKGNITQYTDRSGAIVTMLWGYNSSLPVAKVLNATAAVARTYVSQSVLNNPSDDGALRVHLNSLRSITGALVTTYTYKPLVGITSETDPNGQTTFYQYDDFNRLTLVKDYQGNVVKRICYNYSGQINDCTDVASWANTGNTRCKPCSANVAYISNIQQNESRDLNPNSPTYNQTAWVDAGVSSACVTAAWVPTATAVRCVKDINNQNTGYVEREEMDMNPCSAGFNQRRWVVFEYNASTCPLPVTCNTGNCSGINKRCVFGVCETGIMVIDTYERDEMGRCMMYYHYEWSDGSQSDQYSQAASSYYCNQ
jgi:YD repeat-containing protein